MGSFEVTRSATIAADPARVHALIDDFREWLKWSPWEEVDPNLERTYSGAEKGVGAKYAWKGNRKAGVGSMEITESTPEEIDIALRFIKPFKGDNRVVFAITPAGEGTDVTWTMQGEQKGLAALFGMFMSMDKLVGKDFEKGLGKLKTAAEA